MAEDLSLGSTELDMLRLNKESAYNYRERRHDDWDENYMLYRDKVTVNRLTQRQSVNIPLMKQTLRTLLKDVDDMPVLHFENLDNDKDAELFKNEYWKYTAEKNNMEVQDIVDKRQVFLYGRSFDQWQIVDGMVNQTIVDPMDILVSKFTNPTNIHSARYLIHTHIFVPLASLERNKDYYKAEVMKMKAFYATEQGLIKAKENNDMINDKNKKLEELGVTDINDPVLGETYVELTLHFVKRAEGDDEEEQIYLYVECDDMAILMKKPLEEVIGVTQDHYFRSHFPYCSWADDVDQNDFWTDGVADIVRTPNKVLNTFFSQMVENRTLKNFNMNVFDATIEGYNPPTVQPIPWGWYGVPGKPDDVYKPMPVADLSESLEEMTFLINMTEKASGATATQQGVQTERKVTLGEVQLALSEAKERIKGMSKFYTPAWKQRGEMFCKLVEAASDKLDAVRIYKKGNNSNDIYSREISPTDWKTQSGYRVKVWSQDEKNAQDTQNLEKLNAVRANIPGNMKLDEIYKRKLLEFGGLTPDEINEVMELEKTKVDAAMRGAAMMGGGEAPPMAAGAPPMAGGQQPLQA